MSTSARQATTTKINGIVILHHSLQLLVQKVPDPSCVKQSLNLANRLDEKSQITRLEWHGPRHAKQITSDTTDFPKKGNRPKYNTKPDAPIVGANENTYTILTPPAATDNQFLLQRLSCQNCAKA